MNRRQSITSEVGKILGGYQNENKIKQNKERKRKGGKKRQNQLCKGKSVHREGNEEREWKG